MSGDKHKHKKAVAAATRNLLYDAGKRPTFSNAPKAQADIDAKSYTKTRKIELRQLFLGVKLDLHFVQDST